MTSGQMVLGLLLGALGVGIIYYAIRLSRKQDEDLLDSTNVLGTVERVDIESRTDDGRTTYYPVLEYEYEYLGDRYTGERIFPGTDRERFGHGDKRDAAEVIEDFKVGDEISVYVDQTDPNRSFVLRERTPLRIKQIAVVGAIFLVFGVFVIVGP